jgi:tetratricopeptide (TPR) repeat protein
MNTLSTVLVSAGVAAVVGGLAAHVAVDDDRGDPVAAAAPAPGSDLGPRLASVEARLDELSSRLADRALEHPAPPRADRAPVHDLDSKVDAAVERWMAEHGAPASAGTAPGERAAAADEAAARDADEMLALLESGTLSAEEQFELVEELRKLGRVEEAIAICERLAEESPNDPAAHVSLAQAYISKIQEVGAGPEAGVWAMKADRSYDRALALDERNWDARFGKATSLSFWPPIFGKQGEAVREFETLLEIQSAGPPQPSHAQTYLFLGNLYQQTGRGEDAVSVWKQGAELFTDDEELAEKVASFGQD